MTTQYTNNELMALDIIHALSGDNEIIWPYTTVKTYISNDPLYFGTMFMRLMTAHDDIAELNIYITPCTTNGPVLNINVTVKFNQTTSTNDGETFKTMTYEYKLWNVRLAEMLLTEIETYNTSPIDPEWWEYLRQTEARQFRIYDIDYAHWEQPEVDPRYPLANWINAKP